MLRGSNNTPNVLNFLHITDSHLLDHPEETFHEINTKTSLKTVMAHSHARFPDIDFILLTGDISQTGSEQSYAIFDSVIQPYHLPIYCVPGNHDSPELLQQVVPNCPDSTINIIQLGKFELILINSLVKDQNHGMVSQHCLQQLDAHLKNNKDRFSIIAIHHPPVLTNSEWLDDLGLKNKDELLQLINKYHRDTLLLSGHIHQEIDHSSGKLRILTTPSTCHQFRANCDYMHRTIDTPPAYRYVKLTTPADIKTKVYYIKEKEIHDQYVSQQRIIA